MSGPSVAIAWYTEEDYARIRRLMADAKDMHDTFPEWRESAKDVVDMAESQGLAVRRVYIGESFLTWCRERGLRADGKSRAKFTTERAAEQDRIWGDP